MKRLALIVVTGVLLAGCGGSGRMSKSAYEQKLQSDVVSAQASVTALAKTTPTSLADLAKRIDAAETTVRNAADNLDSLKPPSDASADNDAIVAALRRIEKGLEQVKSDPTGAQSIVAAIEGSPDVKAAEKAIADLKKKGYKIPAISLP